MDSKVRQRSLCVTFVVLFLSVPNSRHGFRAEVVDPKNQARVVEFGITMALTGGLVRAESAFVSVLSNATLDPRALTGLGNLCLLRGEPETAVVFYEQAFHADTIDAGILLNRSIAWMVLGDEVKARRDAARALRLTGGLAGANSLLGLQNLTPQSKPVKGADRPYLSPEEVETLLTAASNAIPADTVLSADSTGKGELPDSSSGSAEDSLMLSVRPRTWRPAGLRAADQQSIATILYWKR